MNKQCKRANGQASGPVLYASIPYSFDSPYIVLTANRHPLLDFLQSQSLEVLVDDVGFDVIVDVLKGF